MAGNSRLSFDPVVLLETYSRNNPDSSLAGLYRLSREEVVRDLFSALSSPDDGARWDRAVQVINRLPRVNLLFEELRDATQTLLLQAAFFLYAPWVLLLLAGAWLMVFAGWIDWLVALLLSVAVLVVVYAFLVSFRVVVDGTLRRRWAVLRSIATGRN